MFFCPALGFDFVVFIVALNIIKSILIVKENIVELKNFNVTIERLAIPPNSLKDFKETLDFEVEIPYFGALHFRIYTIP